LRLQKHGNCKTMRLGKLVTMRDNVIVMLFLLLFIGCTSSSKDAAIRVNAAPKSEAAWSDFLKGHFATETPEEEVAKVMASLYLDIGWIPIGNAGNAKETVYQVGPQLDIAFKVRDGMVWDCRIVHRRGAWEKGTLGDLKGYVW
jgi:hypothetical protein